MSELHTRLSYSQIDTFRQCPRKWTYRYIDNIKFDEQNIHLDYGSAVHKGLENALLDLKVNHKIDAEDFLQTVKQLQYNYAYGDPEKELYWYAIKDMERLIHYQGFYEKIKNKEIVGVEDEFDLKIPTMFCGEEVKINIKGYIDLIYRDSDNKLVVVDHKTSKKKFDKKKRRTNLQIPIYFMAIKDKYGEYPKSGIYNFTKLNTFQEQLFTQKVTQEQNELMNKRNPKKVWSKDPEDSRKEIIQAFKDMNNKKVREIAKPTALCHWCEYKPICPSASNWKPKEKK